MNQRVLGIFLSYCIIIVQAIIGFAYVPILLYFLGNKEYGIYKLMGSMVSYFAIMDFGLSTAVTRFYTKYKTLGDYKHEENLLAMGLRLYCIISVLIIVIGMVVYFNIDNIFVRNYTIREIAEIKAIYIILLFNIAITIGTQCFSSIINAWERFIFLRGLSLLQILMQPFFVILLAWKFPYAISIVIIQSLLNISLIIIRIWYSFKVLNIKIHFYFWDKMLLKSIGLLAGSTFVVFVVDQIFWQSNQVILGILKGPTSVTIYSIAATIYMAYMPISTSISSVFLPRMTRLVALKASNEEINKIFITVGRFQFILLMLVFTGFIIFGKEFIGYWVGNEYQDAYWIAIIIMLPFTIDLIQNIGLTLMQAKNVYWFRAKTYFFSGCFSIVLSIFLVNYWGGIGCAIASGIAMFISNGLIMNWYYNECLHLDIKGFWTEIYKLLLCILASLPIGYLLNILSLHSVYFLAIKILIFTLFYSIIMWKFGLTLIDKEMILEKINLISSIRFKSYN